MNQRVKVKEYREVEKRERVCVREREREDREKKS